MAHIVGAAFPGDDVALSMGSIWVVPSVDSDGG
jgi:hypothetical protein